MKACLVSFYSRMDEYPTRFSLSTLRLAGHAAAQEDLSGLELKVLPLKLDEDPHTLASTILQRDFDIIGLPSYMWNSSKSRMLAHELKARDPAVRIITGGPHTETFDHENWPEGTLFVLGEGEAPFHWALKETLEGRVFSEGNLHQATYLRGGDRSKTHKHIARELEGGIPLYSDRFMEVFEDPKSMETSFSWHDTAVSCPYTCGYCGHKTRPNVALRPDRLTEEEIRMIGKRGFESVFIIDPILGGLPGRDERILGWYRSHAPDTRISAYYRPEYFTDASIRALAASNIEELLIGLQSTNPEVPRWLRSNNLSKVNRYLPQLSQSAIPSRIELITGLPGDTPQGQRESLRFVVEEIEPSSIWSYHLTVIPGTLLHRILDADKAGAALWVHADKERSRATESSSYSAQELDEMLIYAGAVTSLYNTLQERTGRHTGRTLTELEALIRPVLSDGDPEVIDAFRRSDMIRSKRYWDAVV